MRNEWIINEKWTSNKVSNECLAWMHKLMDKG